MTDTLPTPFESSLKHTPSNSEPRLITGENLPVNEMTDIQKHLLYLTHGLSAFIDSKKKETEGKDFLSKQELNENISQVKSFYEYSQTVLDMAKSLDGDIQSYEALRKKADASRTSLLSDFPLEEELKKDIENYKLADSDINNWLITTIIVHDLRQPAISIQKCLEGYLRATTLEDLKPKLPSKKNAYQEVLDIAYNELARMRSLQKDGLQKEMLTASEIKNIIDGTVQVEMSRNTSIYGLPGSPEPRINIDTSLPPFISNDIVTKAALNNIISNAAKSVASLKGEKPPLEIHISAQEVGGYVEIAITDNGKGLDDSTSGEFHFKKGNKGFSEDVPSNGYGGAIISAIFQNLGGAFYLRRRPDRKRGAQAVMKFKVANSTI